jgi:hypothetical protein
MEDAWGKLHIKKNLMEKRLGGGVKWCKIKFKKERSKKQSLIQQVMIIEKKEAKKAEAEAKAPVVNI